MYQVRLTRVWRMRSPPKPPVQPNTLSSCLGLATRTLKKKCPRSIVPCHAVAAVKSTKRGLGSLLGRLSLSRRPAAQDGQSAGESLHPAAVLHPALRRGRRGLQAGHTGALPRGLRDDLRPVLSKIQYKRVLEYLSRMGFANVRAGTWYPPEH